MKAPALMGGQPTLDYTDLYGLDSWGELGDDLGAALSVLDPAYWGSTKIGMWAVDAVPASVRNPAAHFWIGVGDAATFGGTRWIRSMELYGGNTYTDECTRSYIVGEFTGDVAMLIATWGTSEFPLAAKLFDKSVTKARFFRWGLGRFKLGDKVARRLHVHLGFGIKGIMKYHLPYQTYQWSRHLWGGYLGKMLF